MSLARLFLSGLLVAGGLILGAFALHGYFDPDWASRRMQAAKAGPPSTPVVNTFRGRDRFVVSRAESSAAPAIVKASVSSPAAGPKTEAKATAKVAAKKKQGEKAKGQEQAAVQWPWSLFNND